MPFHSCTFWRTSYACMDGKFDLKRWIMYFHIIPKWNQQQTAPPQFTKALLHLYSCYFIMMIKIFCICIFPWKREKSSLMIVIKNVSFHKIFKILFIDSMYKRKFMVAPFHLHLRFPNGVLRLIYVSPYTYWVLENSSISNESSCTYLKQGKWLWNLHAHSKPHVSF